MACEHCSFESTGFFVHIRVVVWWSQIWHTDGIHIMFTIVIMLWLFLYYTSLYLHLSCYGSYRCDNRNDVIYYLVKRLWCFIRSFFDVWILYIFSTLNSIHFCNYSELHTFLQLLSGRRHISHLGKAGKSSTQKWTLAGKGYRRVPKRVTPPWN